MIESFFRYNKQLYCLVELPISSGVRIKTKSDKYITLLIGSNLPADKKRSLVHSLIKGKKLTDINGRKIK